MLRPGYLYIFRKGRLWRELEIDEQSRFSDVDLEAVRAEVMDTGSGLRVIRPSSGDWLDDLLIPAFLQGRAVMHDFRMASSEVQRDWSYIAQLAPAHLAPAASTTRLRPA